MAKSILGPYRVLDLTDEKGLLCGKLLGDLGADVIKIEKPGGDPARNIGPFYHDEVNPEKSLFWFAMNANKRGITLDIESAEGRELFKKLVKTSDFIIESFPPGYLEKLGLGYGEIKKLNPGIIMVSISPFGQAGPYKDYKAPDIVPWAMGGVMYSHGHTDRPPIRISHHSQAYMHAGCQAAIGALIAHYHRQLTGEGQYVDVSIQESVYQATYQLTATWDMIKTVHWRGTGLVSNVKSIEKWPCKDGYIEWFYFGGMVAKQRNLPLVKWMESEGVADDFISNFTWDNFDLYHTTQALVDRLSEPTSKLFIRHTKAELLEEAIKRRIMLYPVSDAKDILESVQLASREFWVKLYHPELRESITYPGAFAKVAEAPPVISRRAPLIGEHNREVFAELENIDSKRPHRPAKIANGARNSGEPLEGIRVADFSWAGAGPLGTKIFSDFGAEVIKIESTARPDVMRTRGPYKDNVEGANRSGQFNQWNTGKLSLCLNLTNPRGVEVAKRLVACSDIVIESFAGGVMEKLGLGYQHLKKINSDIIMLSSCMQGQTGPHANHPGVGYHLTALSGIAQIAGWPDREPADLGPYTDFIAPVFNTVAILAALDYRQRTGEGLYIDMSQYENAIHFISPLILDYVVNKRIGNREGNRCSSAAPHGAYRCKGEDRWCAIAVFTDEEWHSFCRVIGNPSWSKEARFATLKNRKENEDELDILVNEWTINHSAEEIMKQMQEAGVAAGILQTGEDLLEKDPQLKHRRFFQKLGHPEVGIHRVYRPPYLFSTLSHELKRAPLMGEHNEYILKQILNISDSEVAEMVISGILE